MPAEGGSGPAGGPNSPIGLCDPCLSSFEQEPHTCPGHMNIRYLDP